jgi:hypothetical protein
MTFNSALTAEQLVSLRGDDNTASDYRPAVYISLNGNANVYTARVNQSSFTDQLLELTYDGGAGTLSDVRVDMTVLVSNSDDRTKAHFRGRVRLSPTSTTLYINETSNANFADGDHIFIIDDYDLHQRLARDGQSGTIFIDWDQEFTGLKPLIYDIQPVYASFADSVTGKYQIPFTPTVTAAEAPTGRSIISYLWEFPSSGVTIDAGTINDKDITLSFDPAVSNEYWIHLTAEDSNFVSITRHIKIFVYGKNDEPDLNAFDELSLDCAIDINPNNGASEGWIAGVVAYADMENVLDRTLCFVWQVEKLNGVETNIVNNAVMVGRFSAESNNTEYLQDAESGQFNAVSSFEIEGPLAQLARLNFYPVAFANADDPSDYRININTLTVWRVVWATLTLFTTFGEIYPVSFGDIDDDFEYLFFSGQGGDTLNTLADYAQSINSVIQAHQDGAIQMGWRSNMLPTADRSGIVKVADLTTEDITLSYEIARPYLPQVASVDGSGGSYTGNSASQQVDAFLATAPPGVPTDSASNANLARQILQVSGSETTQQDQLVQRVGDAFAAVNGTDTLTVVFNSGWQFLTPAVDQRYTVTIPASSNVRGIAYDTTTNWWLQAISKSWSPQSALWEVTGVLVKETDGSDGTIVTLPIPNSGPYGNTLVDFNGFNELLPIDFVTAGGNLIDDPGGWEVQPGGGGSHSPGNGWQATCFGGDDFIDIAEDISTCELTSITVTYTGVNGAGSDGTSQIYIRDGNGAWQSVHQFTSAAGSTSETVTLNEVHASGIRVKQFAPLGVGDCSGSLTITDISWTCAEPEKINPLLIDWDFRESPHGFTAELGTYVPESGWRGDDAAPENCQGQPGINYLMQLIINRPFDSTFRFDKGPPFGLGGTWTFVTDNADQYAVQFILEGFRNGSFGRIYQGEVTVPGIGLPIDRTVPLQPTSFVTGVNSVQIRANTWSGFSPCQNEETFFLERLQIRGKPE